MRFPKPFFRRSKQAWYLQLGKRQIALGKDRDEAFARYRQLLLHEQGVAVVGDSQKPLLVAEACDLFLEHCQHNCEPATYDWYRTFLSDFCKFAPSLRVDELKPFHVTKWLQGKQWSSTTQGRAIGALKRVFNWAIGEGLLTENPLRLLKKPPAKRRDRYLSADDRRRILGSAKGKPFRMFLFALGQTGARPGEVARVTAADVDLDKGLWVLQRHKTAKKTGRPRVIYLSPPMVRLTRRLAAEHPDGSLFRNSRQRPRTRNAIRCRFRQLRKKLKLGPGVVAYCYRHAFITDALERGISDATVAELVGHTSTDMIHRHYSHLSEKREHLRQAAAQAARPSGARTE